ncbi:MAG: hypothetical protein R3C11_00260 [Planctomycetaceae bacterium]
MISDNLLKQSKFISLCGLIILILSGCSSEPPITKPCNPGTLPDGVKFFEESRPILSQFPEGDHNFSHASILVIVETIDGELLLPAQHKLAVNKSGFMGGLKTFYVCDYSSLIASAHNDVARNIYVPISDEVSTIYLHFCNAQKGQSPDPDIDDWFVWQLPAEFEEPLIFPTQATGEVTEQMKNVREFAVKHKDKW